MVQTAAVFRFKEAKMSSAIEATVKEIEPMTVAFIKMKGHYNQIPAAFGGAAGWSALLASAAVMFNVQS
jgi:hypothetical protein